MRRRGNSNHVEKYGFGFRAVEVPDVTDFIGFARLKHVLPSLPFAPAVEAGWRLARAYWGRGYASEGAKAALAGGFGRLGLSEIVAYATADNLPSRRVMERIGMNRDPSADFGYKELNTANGSRCVLYRKRNGEDTQDP